MLPSIVSTSQRLDLVAVTATWRWEAFYRESGRPFEDVLEVANRTATLARLISRSLVLPLVGEPIGTASLTSHDLDERPELTPWLAGMYVAPHARWQGYAMRLISTIDEQASAGSIAALWLYTNTAERIYAGAGWETVEIVQHNAKPFALMRRDR